MQSSPSVRAHDMMRAIYDGCLTLLMRATDALKRKRKATLLVSFVIWRRNVFYKQVTIWVTTRRADPSVVPQIHICSEQQLPCSARPGGSAASAPVASTR